MRQGKTLVKQTGIYAIGNLGSKILSYIMVLVYSYYIQPDEMGYYDLILVTITMVQPIVLMQINDAVYRFLLEKQGEPAEKILGTSFSFLCITVGISELILLALSCIYHIDYAIWIGLYLATIVFYTYFQDCIRAINGGKFYAFVGVFNSVVMLVVEVIGLVILDMGVLALLMSKVVAAFMSILVMVTKREFKAIFKVQSDRVLLGDLLRYSAPLVPNTICWWIVNMSDRYIVSYFLGVAANGIYAIANKFPAVLITITSVFYLAWQESAIKEYDSPNRNHFFSEVFNKYSAILLSLSLCAIPASRLVIELFMESAYKNAWEYTGVLFLAVVFSSLSSFLGIGYQISKETKRSLVSTSFSALLNIVINVLLIEHIGLMAASISTLVAYIVLFGFRMFHTKRYYTLTVDWKLFALLSVLCIIVIVLLNMCDILATFLLLIGCVLVCFAVNKNELKKLLNL